MIDEEYDMDCEEDLGRRERRRMYLSGHQKLFPELKHADPVQTLSSGHFSLLQVRERGDKMPNEVFDQVAQSLVIRQGKRPDLNKKMAQWYPTTEPAKSGVIQTKLGPTELVPSQLLAEGGASSQSARLKQSSINGVKDTAVLSTQAFASTGIRLANNFEIGVEVCNTLVQ